MFYSAFRVKGYICVLVSGFSKSRNLKFSFFQTGELNYSLFENPNLLLKYYLLLEIQTFSFPRIVRY